MQRCRNNDWNHKKNIKNDSYHCSADKIYSIWNEIRYTEYIFEEKQKLFLFYPSFLNDSMQPRRKAFGGEGRSGLGLQDLVFYNL